MPNDSKLCLRVGDETRPIDEPILRRPCELRRLALALGLYTGQARQDVVLMGPQHVRDEVLHWVKGKTELTAGVELAIPVHSALGAIIEATPSGQLTLLASASGKTPYRCGLWQFVPGNSATWPIC